MSSFEESKNLNLEKNHSGLSELFQNFHLFPCSNLWRPAGSKMVPAGKKKEFPSDAKLYWSIKFEETERFIACTPETKDAVLEDFLETLRAEKKEDVGKIEPILYQLIPSKDFWKQIHEDLRNMGCAGDFYDETDRVDSRTLLSLEMEVADGSTHKDFAYLFEKSYRVHFSHKETLEILKQSIWYRILGVVNVSLFPPRLSDDDSKEGIRSDCEGKNILSKLKLKNFWANISRIISSSRKNSD